VVLEADRGIIYDRHGTPLVENSAVWSLVVTPAALAPDPFDRAVELETLARVAATSAEQLAARLAAADAFGSITIKRDLSLADQLTVNERLPRLPGVALEQREVRHYVDPLVFGHVLGYVGPIDPSQLPRLRASGYRPDQMVGKIGIEAGLEPLLRGTDGW